MNFAKPGLDLPAIDQLETFDTIWARCLLVSAGGDRLEKSFRIVLDLYTPGGYVSTMDKQIQKQLITRLNRIEGQVKGLKRMVSDEEYCMNIIMQIMSVRGALKSAALLVLENHLKTCVKSAMSSNDQNQSDEKVDELIAIYKQLGM